MTGTLVTLLREPGERVKKGDGLLVMEAMKMEHTIAPPLLVRCRYSSFNPATW